MSVRRTTRRCVIGAGSTALAWTMGHPPPSAFGRFAAPGSPPADLSGRVIWPQDPDYEDARWDFNTRVSRFPAAIVICADTRDVQNAIRWARQEDFPLRARSGGHSYEAFSTVDDAAPVALKIESCRSVDLLRNSAAFNVARPSQKVVLAPTS